MKHLLLLAFVFCAQAFAGPILTADPYPAGPNQPTSCSVDVNGAVFPCKMLPTVVGSAVVPTADLSALTRPGVYQVALTVSTVPIGCQTAPSPQWDCGYGGSASAGPFQLTLRVGPVPPAPVARLAP